LEAATQGPSKKIKIKKNKKAKKVASSAAVFSKNTLEFELVISKTYEAPITKICRISSANLDDDADSMDTSGKFIIYAIANFLLESRFYEAHRIA